MARKTPRLPFQAATKRPRIKMNISDIFKIVRELDYEVNKIKKLRFILLITLTVLSFIIIKITTVNKLVPYFNFLTDISRYGPVDEVFVNLSLFILSFVVATLIVWLLFFIINKTKSIYFHLQDYAAGVDNRFQ